MAPLEIDQIQEVALTVTLGEKVVLPETVTATYNDGSEQAVAVTWNENQVNDAVASGEGTYQIDGETTDGSTVKATLTIAPKNFVVNPGFENSDTTMWNITFPDGVDAHAEVKQNKSNAKSGEYSLDFWNDQPVDFGVSQTITGLETGYYQLSMFIQGGEADGAAMELYAETSNQSYAAETFVDGWVNWQQPVIDQILVTDGEVTIGVQVQAPENAWGTLDDFYLKRVGDYEEDPDPEPEDPDTTPEVDPDPDENKPDMSVLQEVGDQVYLMERGTRDISVKQEVIDQLSDEATLIFAWQGIRVEIPVSILKGKGDISFQFGGVTDAVEHKHEDRLSDLIDFTLKANGETIDFEQAINVTFSIDGDRVKDWEHVIVNYIDENGDVQEQLTPTSYNADTGEVTAAVKHFSIYGVFEETVEDESEPLTDKTNQLPDTATTQYHYIVAGILFLMLGSTSLWYIRKKTYQ
ncbi:Ig-like domain-containing protein [Gracilibacillus caseinilyticus]|uniref:Ig-like domain-containing protein n=1 Tax=Gracilibacillus caseinilyticus TaxID=2932256 RepID=A0ABY4F1W3_9BACI|nr:Ig-like domain-containing protein [Gracilibacillus caseinilyticus]